MAQKNIKDNDKKKLDLKVKEEIKAKIAENAEQKQERKPNNDAIQLKPQEAYKFFQEEQKRLEQLNADLQQTEEVLFELDKTIFALTELEYAKDKEVLINFGNGIFSKAKLDDNTKFIVNTGSKAMLTKTSKDMIAILEKRKQRGIANAKKVNELLVQTQSNINSLYKYLSQLQQTQNAEKKA